MITFPVKVRCLVACSPVSIGLGVLFRRLRELVTPLLFVVIPILPAKRFVVWHHDEKALMEVLLSPDRACESSCVRGESKTLLGT